jgi:hypothetical protein
MEKLPLAQRLPGPQSTSNEQVLPTVWLKSSGSPTGTRSLLLPGNKTVAGKQAAGVDTINTAPLNAPAAYLAVRVKLASQSRTEAVGAGIVERYGGGQKKSSKVSIKSAWRRLTTRFALSKRVNLAFFAALRGICRIDMPFTIA